MAKTEFEKRVIIKARRLRRKKSFFEQCQKEIHEIIMAHPDMTIENAMKLYIQEAGDKSVEEKKISNAKQKLS